MRNIFCYNSHITDGGVYMHFEYETSRLILQTLDESSTDRVLDFLYRGRAFFDPVEPPKPDNFYTKSFQAASLSGERAAFLSGTYRRYYFSTFERPEVIIGTASFSNIIRGAYRSCMLGYKLLPEFQKKGYALEGISRLITAVFEEDRMHRIEAYALPNNYASINLLSRLGFQFECLSRSVIMLRNGFCDHNRYFLLNPLDMH